MMPDEKGPWAAARAFGAALSTELGDRLAGAYVVGSLAHRAFVAGLSRIEVTVVVHGDRTDDAVDLAVDTARRGVAEIPEIRCVVLGLDELQPPYPPERETAPEVLRLEDEGVRIAGSELRGSIRRPSADDLMAYVRWFDALARETAFRTDSDELPPYYDLYGLAAAACRHYVFAKEHLVIWPKRDALVAFCMGHQPHPGVPLARRLGELGPTPPAAHIPSDTGDQVRELWHRIHREILR